jgi:hypothetical protein
VKAVRLLGQEGELQPEVRDGRLQFAAIGQGYRIIRVEWVKE